MAVKTIWLGIDFNLFNHFNEGPTGETQGPNVTWHEQTPELSTRACRHVLSQQTQALLRYFCSDQFSHQEEFQIFNLILLSSARSPYKLSTCSTVTMAPSTSSPALSLTRPRTPRWTCCMHLKSSWCEWLCYMYDDQARMVMIIMKIMMMVVIMIMMWSLLCHGMHTTPVQDKKVSSHDFSPTPYWGSTCHRNCGEISCMIEKAVDHLLGYLQQLSSSVISMSLVKM